jgi:hypothetical protein
MRTTWAVAALGIGLLSAGAPARGETVIGDYLPVVRTSPNAPAAGPAVLAAPVPVSAAAPPVPAPATAAPPVPPPLTAANGPPSALPLPPPAVYSPPVVSAGPVASGWPSGGCGCGGNFQDPCFCGFPCVWGSVDYLQLWIRNGFLPAMVTAGPGPARPVLDRADTVILRGGGMGVPSHAGAQGTVGFGIPSDHPADPCCVAGFEVSGFFTDQRGNDFRATSEGVPVIGRPFVDVSTGVPVQVVADVAGVVPAVRGGVQVNTQNGAYGLDLNGVFLLLCDCARAYRVDLLVGARAWSIHEDLTVNENLTVLGTGERLFTTDKFVARNRFYGGQLGVRGEMLYGNFFVQGTGKLAVGLTAERAFIDGFTIDQFPGFDPVRATGGVLAQLTNIGRHYHNEFSLLPEVALKVGYQVNSCLRLSAGYSFLYLSNVVRPGDQIDLAVNSSRVPVFAPGVVLPAGTAGPDRPAFQFNQNNLWTQGVTLGAEFRY